MNRMIDYQQLIHQFSQSLDTDRVITDKGLCHTFGTDASCYQLTPEVIVIVNDLTELKSVLAICRQHKAPYTYRAAGTSLSGQAVTDSVLIKLSDQWQQYQIIENGKKIKLQAGIIGAKANQYLSSYSRKIGPDPASINACKIAGIVANNASGMCCGTSQNSYQTVADMSLVFSDGTSLDTADANSVSKFKTTHKNLLSQLQQLAQDTRKNQNLSDLIRHKYRLKNTCGFSINALIDFEDPIEILKHLMVGSEGSLGFIADITMNTVPDNQFKSSALYLFENIEMACNAVTLLQEIEISAVELMDGYSLKSISNHPLIEKFSSHLSSQACGLLMETQADNKELLDSRTEAVKNLLKSFVCKYKIEFSTNPKISTALWDIRKGLFPAVGAVREQGSTVIIEDVAFPIENLAVATKELQQLLHQNGYHQAIIFGHALNGNLHFVFTPDFSKPDQVEQYKNFMQQLSELVAVKYQGSLKAEHGTGRNMAPFVELEWGQQAYALMQKIKKLFDPENIINPGVIINSNQNVHLENLKQLPAADQTIDQCIECGFCEPQCPSKNLTLTPRQRIVMYRKIQTLRSNGKIKQEKLLSKQFDYLGIDTCAATGLCQQACPVGINTADLVKKLRHRRHQNSTKLADWVATKYSTATNLIKYGLGISRVLQKLMPKSTVDTTGKRLRKLSGNRIPIWFSEYPTYHFKSKPISTSALDKKLKVIYIPSCAARNMGTQSKAVNHRNLDEVTLSLLEKSGYSVVIPDNINQLCCGLPFSSKGYFSQAQIKYSELEKLLLEKSHQGEIQVLMDSSSCAKHANEHLNKQISIQDPIDFISENILEKLTIKKLDETVMLHITCSSRLDNQNEALIKIANSCTKKVIVPEHIKCCGWAGDKGFTVPELNQSALKTLKQQVPENCKRGFSTNITCEIGLSHHSGIPYQSILYLLDEVSQPI